MNFTLHQMRVFHAVAETGSVTRAGDMLYLSQPAVSVQLRNFSRCFGSPLYEWVGKRLVLTELGERVLEDAREILNRAEQLGEQAQTDGLTGKIAIASVSTGKYLLPRFLADFAASHPAVALQLTVTNRQSVLQSLAEGEMDYAFVSRMPAHLECESLELLPNRLFIVAPAGWEIPREDEALNSWLEASPFIMREPGSGTRQAMERFLQARGVSPWSPFELATNEAVKQAVVAGMGISLMAEAGFQAELRLGQIEVMPVGEEMDLAWRLIRLKTKPISPLREHFESHMLTRAPHLVAAHFPFVSLESRTNKGESPK